MSKWDEMFREHAERLGRIESLLAENARLKSYIEEMVRIAGEKHRPAYDEQQKRIMALEDENAQLRNRLHELYQRLTDTDDQPIA